MLAQLMDWLHIWHNKYAVMVLAAAAGLGAYETVPWSSLTASDWGTWVGSIGTVGTLIGTIWLATSEQRKRERESIAVARLRGASMVLRLTHAETMVTGVCRTLWTAIETPIALTVDHVNDMSFKLSSVELWSVDDVVPLIPLSGNAAVKLAQIADRIQMANGVLTRTAAHFQTLSNDERLAFTHFLYELMTATNVYLRDVTDLYNHAADDFHRPFP